MKYYIAEHTDLGTHENCPLARKNLQGTRLTASMSGEERESIHDKQIKRQGGNSNIQSILEGRELYDV